MKRPKEGVVPPAFPPRRTRPGTPYADAPQLPGERGAKVELSAIFPAHPDAPYELEIGGGRGVFIFERAAAAPEACVLGLEVKRKWAAIVDRKLGELGLHARARCFAEDARIAVPRLVPDGRVRAIFLHFPDPWWKKRHEKRIVLGPGMQDEIERLLAVGGELFVQTDVEMRAEQYRSLLESRPALEPFGDAPGDPMLAENPYGARSPREKRAIADGLPIHRMRFRKRG